MQYDQLRQAIAAVTRLDAEWRQSTAGRDNLATYLPYMPFSWTDFIALTAEALPETTGDKFLDVGCGIGTKMLLADAFFGLSTQGIERSPEMVKEARQHGLVVTEADALGWDGYGNYDVVFFNRPFFGKELQARLEAQVWADMKPGAVVIGVNLLAPPPPTWWPVLDDGEVRRWIAQKP
jgi:trans-aconitate methyltransferase